MLTGPSTVLEQSAFAGQYMLLLQVMRVAVAHDQANVRPNDWDATCAVCPSKRSKPGMTANWAQGHSLNLYCLPLGGGVGALYAPPSSSDGGIHATPQQ